MGSYEYDDYYDYVVPDLDCSEVQMRYAPPGFFADDMAALHCNSTFDTAICWPTTLAGHIARIKCPTMFDGITLVQHADATKECLLNGTWVSQADYSACLHHQSPQQTRLEKEEELHNFATRVIYYVGFTVSTAALLIALFIFCYFRKLRCLRNSIHCNLMVSFILRNILWIVMHNVLPSMTSTEEMSELSRPWNWMCPLMVTAYNYLHTANFFWMLVEGLYLYIMIVWAYSVDNIRIWVYAVLGWGVPLIVIIVWAVLKTLKDNSGCWLPHSTGAHTQYYDLVFIVPILVVLFINTCCLVSTVYIIITKLKATNAQQTRQFWQALKGTLILFPLLGVIFVVLITPPGDNPIARRIFQYFNAIAHGLQGFMVAMFYCFLHREVRLVLRNRLFRWRETRSFASTRRPSRGDSILTKADQSVMLIDANTTKTNVKSNGNNIHVTFSGNKATIDFESDGRNGNIHVTLNRNIHNTEAEAAEVITNDENVNRKCNGT